MIGKYKWLLPLLAISVVSCGPKPEEACDCLRESANKFMLAGEKPSSEELVLPCSEFVGKFDDDKEGKLKLSVCVKEIEKQIDEKKLFSINGKTPQFPEVTTPFDSILIEFRENKYAAEYKYRHRKVKVDVLLAEMDSTSDGKIKLGCAPITGGKDGGITTIATRINIPVTYKQAKNMAASSPEYIFDTKNHRSIEFDDRWYESKVASLSELYSNIATGRQAPRMRNISADYLQDCLEGKIVTNTLFGGPVNALQKIANSNKALADEVKNGNYVLLNKEGKHRLAGKYSNNYFNKLTIEGKLLVKGRNGYNVPVFEMTNSNVVKNENLFDLAATKSISKKDIASANVIKQIPEEEVVLSGTDDEYYYD